LRFLYPGQALSGVEFNLLSGANINVTVWEGNVNCNPQNSELTNNCIKGLSATCKNDLNRATRVLFTNLTPGNTYTMAIWTDEDKQNDFSFCLTRAPQYECGDGVCYSLVENVENCAEDCTLLPTGDECLNLQDIDFFIANDFSCNCFKENTTIGATFNSNTDIFSCDDDTLIATLIV